MNFKLCISVSSRQTFQLFVKGFLSIIPKIFTLNFLGARRGGQILFGLALLLQISAVEALPSLPGPFWYEAGDPNTPPFSSIDAACQSPDFFSHFTVGAGTYVNAVLGRPGLAWCFYSFSWGIQGAGVVELMCPVPGSTIVGATLTSIGNCVCPSGTFNNVYKQMCAPAHQVPIPAGNTKDNCCHVPKFDVADPINPAIGNNWRTETDFAASTTIGGLSFSRTYNSNVFSTDAGVMRSIGTQWTQSFDRKAVQIANPQQTPSAPLCYQWADDLRMFCVNPPATLTAAVTGVSFVRPNGKSYSFGLVGSTWVGDGDVSDRVSATYATDGVTIAGWTYVTGNGDQTEQYDGNGNLLSVTSRSGAVQAMTYSNGLSNDSSAGRYPANAPVCPNVEAGAVLPAGLLLCVTDNWGHQIQFEYDANSRITKMIDPNNQPYLYTYDGPSGGCVTPNTYNQACSSNNLTQVTYPDGSYKTYWYNETAQINGGAPCQGDTGVAQGFGALLNALTGIVDENGTRYTSWNYDCTGRATSNQLAGGVKQTTLAYGTTDPITGDSTTTLTDTVGTSTNPQTNVHTFGFKKILGVSKFASVDHPCTECGTIAAYTYDANGNVASSTDFNGNVTSYTYDLARNLELSRTEAAGTAQARTTTTQWHATFHLPTLITEPGRTTSFTYDANGNQLTKTISSGGTSRTWTYTYNPAGQILTVTGPRSDVSDVTTYAYDAGGNLNTVTNALGQVTTLSNYDAAGRVGTITDPNGATTALSYSSRGWLTSKIVTAGAVSQITLYNYDAAGQLISVTLPDGSGITNTYDAAHRLTGIADSMGDSIAYTLDLWGNRIGEQVIDPSGALAIQISRSYDTLNRLQQISLNGQPTSQTPGTASSGTPLTPGSGPLAPTTVTLNAPGSQIPFNQNLTFTAVVSGPGNLAGTVTFFDGTTILSTQTVVNGRAILTMPAPLALSLGTHSLKVSYDSDQYHVIQEPPLTVTVFDPRSQSSVAFIPPYAPGSISAGMPISLWVQVGAVPQPTQNQKGEPIMGISQDAFIAQNPPDSRYPPEDNDVNGSFGTVTFMDGTKVLGTSGVACNMWIDPYKGCFSFLNIVELEDVGTHAITATYSGDAAYKPSSTATVSTTVTPQLTSKTHLVCEAAPPTDNTIFDCSVSVLVPPIGTQTQDAIDITFGAVKTVEIMDGSTVIATVQLSLSDQTNYFLGPTMWVAPVRIFGLPVSAGNSSGVYILPYGVHNLQAHFIGTPQIQPSLSGVQRAISTSQVSNALSLDCPDTLVAGQAGVEWTRLWSGAVVQAATATCSVGISANPFSALDASLVGQTVQLTENGTVLGSATLTKVTGGVLASIPTPALSTGAHTLQVSFPGSGTTPAMLSTAQVIAQ